MPRQVPDYIRLVQPDADEGAFAPIETNPNLTASETASITFGGSNNSTFTPLPISSLPPFPYHLWLAGLEEKPAKGRRINMANPTREEMQAEIAAAEARSDTKIARLDGKLDLVLSKLDDMRGDNRETRDVVREGNRATRANMWVIGLGLAVLIVAVVTLMPVIFDLGATFQEKISDEIEKQVESLPPAPQPEAP